MKISIVICDHCDHVLHGGSFETYRIDNGPQLHICSACQAKPFRKVGPSAKGTAVAEVMQMALTGWSPIKPRVSVST